MSEANQGCNDTRAQLTAYLDGELEGDRGSAVRGHLRGCEACRQVASDEAALRDGLRALPPIDPPPSLWAGVQAKLAAAEIADSEKPAWRRALARWLSPQQLGLAGAALAAVVGVIAWKTHHQHADETIVAGTTKAAPAPHELTAPPPPPVITPMRDGEAADVTLELVAAPKRETASYAETTAALMKEASDVRATWSDEHKREFDGKVATLQAAIDKAGDEHARQHAYRALVRYLQRAATLDEVAIR